MWQCWETVRTSVPHEAFEAVSALRFYDGGVGIGAFVSADRTIRALGDDLPCLIEMRREILRAACCRQGDSRRAVDRRRLADGGNHRSTHEARPKHDRPRYHPHDEYFPF